MGSRMDVTHCFRLTQDLYDSIREPNQIDRDNSFFMDLCGKVPSIEIRDRFLLLAPYYLQLYQPGDTDWRLPIIFNHILWRDEFPYGPLVPRLCKVFGLSGTRVRDQINKMYRRLRGLYVAVECDDRHEIKTMITRLHEDRHKISFSANHHRITSLRHNISTMSTRLPLIDIWNDYTNIPIDDDHLLKYRNILLGCIKHCKSAIADIDGIRETNTKKHR